MTEDVRMERDTFGEIAVPNDRLWGAQTQRSLQNFKISTEKQSPELIHALAVIKRSVPERPRLLPIPPDRGCPHHNGNERPGGRADAGGGCGRPDGRKH